MAEDLIRGMLGTVVSGGDDLDAASASGTSRPTETLPHVFCVQLHTLLNVLHDVFPENDKLATWITVFSSTVLGTPAMEEWVIKKWHYDMTYSATGERLEPDLYTHTKTRDIKALLSSDLWVFKEIEAEALYFHADLDDEDREALCKHFDHINSYARVFSALPDGMREAIEKVTASLDPTQEITHDTMTHLLQNMLNGPTANMEQLMSWASQLVTSFSDGDGLDAMQTLMSSPMVAQATGGLDIATLMASLQSELAGGVDAHVASTGVPDVETLKRCMSVFGLGAGLGSAEASAGTGAGIGTGAGSGEEVDE